MSNEKISVSVIVPAFNEEKCLKRCLDSLVNQTLETIEIVIVDDGSYDRTAEICDMYKNNYPKKIKVIHKYNEGLGPARNTGILKAKGDYIGFIDADDWADSNMYKEMYDKAIKNNSDIVICDIKMIDINGHEKNCQSMISSDENINIEEYLMSGIYPQIAWNKIYKKAIWEKFKFKKMYFEDLDIILSVVSYCQNISYIQKAFNYYCRRENSISNSFEKICYLDKIIAYKDALNNANEKYQKQVEYWVANNIYECLKRDSLKYFKADFLEFLKELWAIFSQNNLIKQSFLYKELNEYVNSANISPNVYVGAFGMNQGDKINITYMQSWENYTRGFGMTFLNEQNCNIDNAPIIIRDAFYRRQYNLVNHYYVLKCLYDNGGIATNIDTYLKKPIGFLRSKIGFVFKIDKNKVNVETFGFNKRSRIVEEMLNAYLVQVNKKEECFSEIFNKVINDNMETDLFNVFSPEEYDTYFEK
ncbi:MAG: glycosyltransferase family 2 protein [Lachnospiraceae bacterium]|nr:glycosyltransferase family 2 protein [Lachnospiraceae bacterium]